MSRGAVFLAGLTAVVGLFNRTASQAQEQHLDRMPLNTQRPLALDQPSQLSPALLAAKDAGGALKGCNDLGNPLISVPIAIVANPRASSAVRSRLAEVAANDSFVGNGGT